MNVTELIPTIIHDDMLWLGRAPSSWMKVLSRPGLLEPRTDLLIDAATLMEHAGAADHQFLINKIRDCIRAGSMLTLAYLEAGSRLIADGPKLFVPTEEQWESMENVEVNIPLSQFRSPYPALAVRIPLGARKRIMAKCGADPDRFPHQSLIRFRHEPGEQPFMFIMSRFGKNELFHTIQDQHGQVDIEPFLQRKIEYAGPDNPDFDKRDRDHEFPASTIIHRAVINLCLMMTHHGCRLDGPLNPNDYQRHRAKRHLQHLRHGDYLAVNMKQNIVVRAPSAPTNNPPGPGTGIEVAPHWVKGHWRAYPGMAAKRAAGEKVPLLFVRPYLVRRDRIKGDISDSEVTYHG